MGTQKNLILAAAGIIVLSMIAIAGCSDANKIPQNMTNANDLKILVDYVTQIRGQDMEHFQALITIFMGTILGGILLAVLANKKGVPTLGRRCIVIIALALFLFFLAGLRDKHVARREFCQKWMGYNISTNKTVTGLIEDFSKQRYGLYYANPEDPNFKLRTEYIPESWLAGAIWRYSWVSWIVEISPYVSAILVFCLVITRSSSNKKNSNMKLSTVIMVIFLLLVSAVHLLRFVFQWKVTANAVEIPLWTSAVACAITAALAIWLWWEHRKEGEVKKESKVKKRAKLKRRGKMNAPPQVAAAK